VFEIKQNKFLLVKHFLANIQCDTIYAYSIVENRQQGRIFVDDPDNPQTALFWHYCGISVIAGRTDNDDFNHVLQNLLCRNYEENQRRFVLYVNDDSWNSCVISLLCDCTEVTVKKRFRFRFNRASFDKRAFSVPGGYTLREIDTDIISRLEGRIIPSYSWHSSEAFLSDGRGYCLMDGDVIACNSFSSGIGNGMIDIGIETMEPYRRKGVAAPTASVMVTYCLNNGFVPSWGCDADNIGSARTAQSLGFEIIGSHSIYVSV